MGIIKNKNKEPKKTDHEVFTTWLNSTIIKEAMRTAAGLSDSEMIVFARDTKEIFKRVKKIVGLVSIGLFDEKDFNLLISGSPDFKNLLGRVVDLTEKKEE